MSSVRIAVGRTKYTSNMAASALLLAGVAAVLCPHRLVFVDVAKGAVARTADLPGDGLALFAAPDGRLVVPLAGEDATALVETTGKVERWRGRVFPMFSADFDRMHTVMPEEIATLSYPDRVAVLRTPLPGVRAARRAACSADGRLVAVVPAGAGPPALVLVAVLEGGTVTRVALAAEAVAVAVAPDGSFAVAVSESGRVEVAKAGVPGPVAALDLGGAARAVVAAPDGRGALVGLARGLQGEIVSVKVDLSSKHSLKERFRTALRAAPTALAVDEEQVVATTAEGVVVLSRTGGSVRREVALAGAAAVALLSPHPVSAVPPWSDGATP